MRISQQMIANRIGVSVATIQHILSGLRNASAPLADKLADMTDSPFRIWLLGGNIEARRQAMQAWKERKQRKVETI